jgi:glycosyltransferase involved in cell wall biosynthesis
MDRGIPLYAEEITECLRRLGAQSVVLRCPRRLRGLPAPLLNLLFVLFEQLVSPLMRIACRCSLTIYPYNSVGLFDALLGRSVMVVHDLIPNARRNRRLSARYIRGTQWVQRATRGTVCAASEDTFIHLRRLAAFRSCPLRLWPNPFYGFQAAIERQPRPLPPSAFPPPGPQQVLLCSGMGRNKDYRGALWLFRHSRSLAGAHLRIIGFGDDAALARRRVARLPEAVRNRIVVLPRLSLDRLAQEYCSADLVWVHSLKEGFGRSVVEGRLSGRPVVASDIAALRRLRPLGPVLYRANGFDAAVARAMRDPASWNAVDADAYHAALEQAVGEELRGRTGSAESAEDLA